MGAKTSIAWCDATWGPVRGCSMAKGSEKGGCLNCYAARFNSRNLPELKSPTTGEPFARILDSGPRWIGKVELIESQLMLPLKWRKPKRIFVNSMSDLFHEALPDRAIDRVFAVMASCPQHTFQCLTKRPKRMLEYLDATKRCAIPGANWWDKLPLPNVWLGVSVEDQKTADARIPLLLRTPAAIRFVSYEPALGPVDFWKATEGTTDPLFGRGDVAHLDQIIVGGESGPGARPFDIAWARQTVRQCREAGVACFVKQLGTVPMMNENRWHEEINATGIARLLNPRNAKYLPAGYVPLAMEDRKGGDMAEWSEDLRVREFPV